MCTLRRTVALFGLVSSLGVFASCSGTVDPGSDSTDSVFPDAAAAQGLSKRPAWATPDRFVSRVAAGTPISIQVHLRMRNEAAAMAEIAAISDPNSAQYGKFLSDADYEAKYAPTDNDVAMVRSHLESAGLTVTDVPANRAYVQASGTSEQIEAAFSTQLGLYNVDSQMRRAPMSSPSLPPTVSARVLTAIGIAEPRKLAPRLVRAETSPRLDPEDRGDLSTCSEWFGEKPHNATIPFPGYGSLALFPCGSYPAQLRRIYGLSDAVRKGNDGTGVSVAIVDAWMSPTLFTDAQTYAAQNDPDYPLDTDHFTAMMAPGIPQPPDLGWYGEQTLDVEAVHAMAPGAKIVYVGAQTNSDKDLIAAINLIIELRLATIVSNSYGGPEDPTADNSAWHSIATQAGLKGIGLYFSSGDNGDEANDPNNPMPGTPHVDWPAAMDNVVAVGGTGLGIGQAGDDLFEVGWANEKYRLLPTPSPDGGTGGPLSWQDVGFVFGGGGGASAVYKQPSWQAGVVPPALATTAQGNARVVPDVAMLADPYTGFMVGQSDPDPTSPTYQQYSEAATGGTSLACPLFAGTMALAQQHAGHRIGFAAPILYKAYKKSPALFRDIAPLDMPQAVAYKNASGVETVVKLDWNGQSIKTATGFDNITGMGTPNGTTFLDAVAKTNK